MKHKARLSILLVTLAALLLAVFAMPAFAASQQVEDVLEQLATLQRADIEAWEGDVRANRQLIEAMLDSYAACGVEERAEFTEDERAALRSYFEVLYALDGRSAAELDPLFALEAESSSPSSESDSPPETSAAPSSAVSSSEASSSGVSSAPPPASSDTPALSAPTGAQSVASSSSSGYVASNLPGPPQEGGWLSLFGNKALGSILLAVLVVLAIIIFARFITALRKAPRAPTTADADLRARELFGENYDPNAPEQPDDAPPEKLAVLKKPPAKPVIAPGGDDFPEEKAAAPVPMPTFMRPAPTPRNAPVARADASSPSPARVTPPEPAAGEALESAPKKIAILPPGLLQRRHGTPKPANEVKPASPAGLSATPPPSIGHNPERAKTDPIATRSFSGPQRNGRPGKMSFRQGDPSDLDAIDE